MNIEQINDDFKRIKEINDHHVEKTIMMTDWSYNSQLTLYFITCIVAVIIITMLLKVVLSTNKQNNYSKTNLLSIHTSWTWIFTITILMNNIVLPMNKNQLSIIKNNEININSSYVNQKIESIGLSYNELYDRPTYQIDNKKLKSLYIDKLLSKNYNMKEILPKYSEKDNDEKNLNNYLESIEPQIKKEIELKDEQIQKGFNEIQKLNEKAFITSLFGIEWIFNNNINEYMRFILFEMIFIILSTIGGKILLNKFKMDKIMIAILISISLILYTILLNYGISSKITKDSQYDLNKKIGVINSSYNELYNYPKMSISNDKLITKYNEKILEIYGYNLIMIK